MTFTSPLLLIAALAAAVPLVLHLISRKTIRRMPFPTLRFLRISVEKTRRRKRIDDILLMLLRMAVLVLIAVGLAGPTLSNMAVLLGGGNSAVVIVLDNSASMSIGDGRRTRFDTAHAAAMQIMDQLADGDAVALLPAVGPLMGEQDKLHTAHEKVLQMLDRCKVGYQKADLAARLKKARELLAESEQPNKQIYVISDMQAVSWANLTRAEEENDSPQRDEAGDAPIILVDCDHRGEPNVALQSVVLTAPVPASGLPITAEVGLFNASSLAVQRYVELFVDGQRLQGSPAIDLPPMGTAKHVFRFTGQGSGVHRGEVRLAGKDGCQLDNSRYFAIELDRGIPVAVVNQQEHEIPYLEDTFFLQRALALGGKTSRAVRASFLSAADLPGESLSKFDIVFCVNLAALDTPMARRLAEYVAGGGNLVWICGDNVDPAAYNAMNRLSEDMLLPVPLLDVRVPGPDNRDESWPVGFLDKDYPAFASLVDPASLYRSILVYKHVRMDVSQTPATPSPTAQVLARLEDGEPLLVERPAGRGRVLMLGISAHTGWSNLPLRPVFLPLLTRLIFELSGTHGTGSDLLAGTPLVLPLEEGWAGKVEVQTAGGETFRLPAEGEKFRFEATHTPGIYVMRLLETTPETVAAFSVNIDPDESDPAQIAPERFQELLPATPLVFAEDATDLTATFVWLREGTSLYAPLLWLVLIGLVLEAFTANRRR